MVMFSALTLFVAQVLFTDHHDPTVSANYLTLLADLFDAWLDLHRPAVFLSLYGPTTRNRWGTTAVNAWGTNNIIPPAFSAIPENDPAFRQVVRTKLHNHPVFGEDPDIVLAHLP